MKVKNSKHLAFACAALMLFPLVAGCDSDSGTSGASTSVTVMTRNIYLGGDLFTLLDPACDGQAILGCVAQLYGTVVASDPATRMAAIADEIEAADADLVGLQEVSTYYTQSPGDHHISGSETQATDVQFDFLQLLLDELSDRGLNYTVAARNMNADVEFPSTTDGTTFTDIRYMDSDVILVRQGVSTSGAVEGNFAINASIPIGGVTVEFTRGYSYVTASKNGVSFTFSNAHLEVGGDAVQAQIAQSTELRSILDSTNDPVVLVGDFNSNPADAGANGTSYRNLTRDYMDAWTAAGTGNGFTCCQDALIRNTTSDLTSRIDLVLYKGNAEATSVSVIGDDETDMVNGLWPSDHAGVVSTLTVRN